MSIRPGIEKETPLPNGAIRRRQKALDESSWGKFVEREHDVKPKSFKFKDSPTMVNSDEYREGWERTFRSKK